MKKGTNLPNISCANCGAVNPISTPFCKECGDRLFKDGAAPTAQEHPKKVAKRHAFRSFLSSLLFLILVSIFGLVLWPYAAVDVPVSSDQSRLVQRYVDEVERQRDSGGRMASILIPQRSLNAFLGQHGDSEAGKLLGTLVSESRILLIANEPLGPFNLSTRLVLKPEEGTTTPFVPTKFWVGHLPLPTAISKPWTQQLADRFELELDSELWDEVKVKTVSRDGIVVDTVFD